MCFGRKNYSWAENELCIVHRNTVAYSAGWLKSMLNAFMHLPLQARQ